MLLDTHLLLWAAGSPDELPMEVRKLIENKSNELIFSTASLWEIAIKNSLGREDFKADAQLLRRGFLDNGYVEIPITSSHAVYIQTLPPVHKDPFDRFLLLKLI